MRALAGSGVGAVVLYSLFEEQVHREQLRDLMVTEAHEDSFVEAQSWFPSVPTTQPVGSARYLRLLEQASASVEVPVIGQPQRQQPGAAGQASPARWRMPVPRPSS